jgi:hypothetical protein
MGARDLLPLQPILDHLHNSADNPSVIDPWLAVRQRKIRLIRLTRCRVRLNTSLMATSGHSESNVISMRKPQNYDPEPGLFSRPHTTPFMNQISALGSAAP